MFQERIGWNHIFYGHLTQQWELIQGDTPLNHGAVRLQCDWMASVVTFLLHKTIELWEFRNSQVHGTDPKERHERLLTHQRQVIETLLSLESKCLARDRFIFPSDPQVLLQQTSTRELGNWIATRKPAIMKSIRRAKKLDSQHTSAITRWFAPLVPTSVTRLLRWKKDRRLHDPYSKKKRHKRQPHQPSGYQMSIHGYLSLNSTFSTS